MVDISKDTCELLKRTDDKWILEARDQMRWYKYAEIASGVLACAVMIALLIMVPASGAYLAFFPLIVLGNVFGTMRRRVRFQLDLVLIAREPWVLDQITSLYSSPSPSPSPKSSESSPS